MNSTELVLSQEGVFNQASPIASVAWEKESQFAIQALSNNAYLANAALKFPANLQNAIINVAAIGISLNPALKHAYLVPRNVKDVGTVVCLDISYQGLMHLALDAGSIEWGQAKLVYANDDYENTGIDKAPNHVQKTFGDKGAIVGAYCTVKLPSGDYLTEEMDIEALDKIKNASKAANGPWKTWPEEMMRKSVVKRASKYWPTCSSLSHAVSVINQHEGLEEVDITPSYTIEQKQELDRIIKDEDAMGALVMSRTLSAEVLTDLFNSFEKGHISKNKQALRDITKAGWDILEGVAQVVKRRGANVGEQEEHDDVVQEEIADLTKEEKKILCGLLDKDDIEYLTLLAANQ